jgi:hypothetical protein
MIRGNIQGTLRPSWRGSRKIAETIPTRMFQEKLQKTVSENCQFPSRISNFIVSRIQTAFATSVQVTRKLRIRPWGSRDTFYPQKLSLTSPTSGCRSLGRLLSRTKSTEFVFCLCWSNEAMTRAWIQTTCRERCPISHSVSLPADSSQDDVTGTSVMLPVCVSPVSLTASVDSTVAPHTSGTAIPSYAFASDFQAYDSKLKIRILYSLFREPSQIRNKP